MLKRTIKSFQFKVLGVLSSFLMDPYQVFFYQIVGLYWVFILWVFSLIGSSAFPWTGYSCHPLISPMHALPLSSTGDLQGESPCSSKIGQPQGVYHSLSSTGVLGMDLRLLHPQYLDKIWIGQDQYRMPLAPLSEYPEPWFWKAAGRGI